MTGLKGVLAVTGLCACAAVAVASEPTWYSDRATRPGLNAMRPTSLAIPGVMTIDLETSKIQLDPRARTEPMEAAADFWIAVETLGAVRACKP